MRSFRTVAGAAAHLPIPHIDTDQILPARFMMTLTKVGLGRHLFNDWRYEADGSEIDDFVLNRPEGRCASILITLENFGCGSSREHAVWALDDFGFRAILAPSFGSIFETNCLKNGLLPVRLDREVCDTLIAQVKTSPGSIIEVDLERQCVSAAGGLHHTFDISEEARTVLLAGLDDISRTLAHEDALAVHEAGQRTHAQMSVSKTP